MDRFPRDPWMAVQHGWVAMRRKDWPDAIARWDFVRRHFPSQLQGYVDGGAALREAGLLDDADLVLRNGMTLFPGEPWLAIHYAWVAHFRADWEDAARRWEDVRTRFPEVTIGYLEGARALTLAGRSEEAAQLLAAAAAKFPDDREVGAASARRRSSMSSRT
jgi:predicted Zn-dependent protease